MVGISDQMERNGADSWPIPKVLPLLDEYWFDDLDRSRKAQDLLIAGM